LNAPHTVVYAQQQPSRHLASPGSQASLQESNAWHAASQLASSSSHAAAIAHSRHSVQLRHVSHDTGVQRSSSVVDTDALSLVLVLASLLLALDDDDVLVDALPCVVSLESGSQSPAMHASPASHVPASHTHPSSPGRHPSARHSHTVGMHSSPSSHAPFSSHAQPTCPTSHEGPDVALDSGSAGISSVKQAHSVAMPTPSACHHERIPASLHACDRR
jgi:hypothetical protein